MENYNPQQIEKKWQEIWEKSEIYTAQDFSKRPKKYILIEFPYPSGEGLHVGHLRPYSALDAVSRKKRMEGYNVLFPIGWDAFGLPAENYAIKTGVHPKETTKKNIANYKKQMKNLGLSFDWNREINTTDPKYYKWTQWIFLQLFKKGLAYQAEIPINWCPSCKAGLANEEVVSGKCERCGTQVEKKIKKQWMLKITKYADRLIDDLEKVDYLEKIKTQQINWIGKSCGVEIDFKIVILNTSSKLSTGSVKDLSRMRGKFSNKLRDPSSPSAPQGDNLWLSVFTTRTDTIFGVTAVVLAPEHSLVEKLVTKDNKEKVINYIEQSRKKSDFERTELKKEKTGVFTGSYCINPVNNEKIPIWVGDYVVATYGGGAVMVVPAHDYRDYDFAKKYKLPVKEVIVSRERFSLMKSTRTVLPQLNESFIEDGVLIDSGQFSGLTSEKARREILKYTEKQGFGRKAIHYKLRDWIFSRQHYWGEPIPLIHCEKCGVVPVSEKDLPVELPYVEKYQPTGTGESPLAKFEEWIKVACPECGGAARRETDTMPNWAGSSWYFMRYTDTYNDKSLADSKKLKYWLPVDWYNGGMEHTTLHLLYSRFWYKFLFDIGIAPQAEPYTRRTSHGIVLAEDGRKMSKSFGNVVNPDDIIKEYGADTLRVYELFMGPFEQAITWSAKGVKGVYRFLEKVWKLSLECSKNEKSNPKIIRAIHQLNKKIDEDLEATKFNTIIASFMKFVNLGMEDKKEVGKDTIEEMLLLLSPFAPHISEELWQKLGHKESIFKQKWPKYDPKLVKEEKINLVIQINGKVRDKIEVEANISEEEANQLTLEREKVKKWIEGRTIKKIVFVKERLINIVC